MTETWTMAGQAVSAQSLLTLESPAVGSAAEKRDRAEGLNGGIGEAENHRECGVTVRVGCPSSPVRGRQ